jgi:hypothetical protein
MTQSTARQKLTPVIRRKKPQRTGHRTRLQACSVRSPFMPLQPSRARLSFTVRCATSSLRFSSWGPVASSAFRDGRAAVSGPEVHFLLLDTSPEANHDSH